MLRLLAIFFAAALIPSLGVWGKLPETPSKRHCIEFLQPETPQGKSLPETAPGDLAKQFDIGNLNDLSLPFDSPGTFRVPMGSMDDEYAAATDELIRFANQQFARRGWAPKFLEERLKLARKFAARSEYVLVRKADPQGWGQITGTLGVTVAHYRSDLTATASELLPMEESHGWKLERPKAHGTEGLIIEARSYAISSGQNEATYAKLWAEMNRIIHREIGNYRELLDSKIIYTYGDEVSIRMYLPMGFELADPMKYPPVMHDGTTWHVLVASPRNFLRRFLSRVKKPMMAKNIGEKKVSLASGLVLPVDGRFVLLTKGKPMALTVSEPVEIFRGVFAEVGSRIGFDDTGEVNYVENLAKDATLAKGLIAKSGWGLAISDMNEVTFTLAAPYTFGGGRYLVEKGSWVAVSDDLTLRAVGRLEKETEISATGLVTSAHSGFQWVRVSSNAQVLEVESLARETEVAPGLFAEKGASVKVRFSSDGQRTVEYISRLSKPARSKSGELLAGAAYYGDFLSY